MRSAQDAQNPGGSFEHLGIFSSILHQSIPNRRVSEFAMFTCLLFLTLATTAPAADAPPTLADTNYPVPENAWFVAPTGIDSHSGKIDAPLRTVSAAINRAPSGSTIVIREGIYRESPGSLNKPLILQPYPHERVWIKGSFEASGWVADPHGWRLDDWRTNFNQASYESGEITTEHPLAGKPEMVFIDDRPLQQVGSLDVLKQATFFVDTEKHAIYIADDPHKKVVEV